MDVIVGLIKMLCCRGAIGMAGIELCCPAIQVKLERPQEAWGIREVSARGEESSAVRGLGHQPGRVSWIEAEHIDTP